MGICTDQATTFLKRLGYNVVRVPRANIEPLQLIGKQDEIDQIGGLNKLITEPSGSLPKISRDEPAANMRGKESSKLSAAVGLNVLDTILGAMGAELSVTAHYHQARRIQFRFTDVLSDSVVPLDVGNYLRDGDVDAGNVLLEQYVLGNGRLYVITRTMKAKTISVMAERRGGGGIELQVPVIEQAVGANIGVSAESQRASTITYEGPRYLVFGFQAYLVGVRNGDITMVSAEPGHVALDMTSTGAVAQGQPAILDDEGLLDLVPAGDVG